VAYSADASGRVPLRFGALSMPGGERRLNVAISRARRKMIVLCSFDPETQLQVGEQTSKGAQILRDFLCYARSVGGTQGDGKARSASHKAPVHHEHAVATNYLAKVLHDWGWRVDQAVGASAARVDLAVRSKRDPGRYMLGILLDGPGASWATTSIGREVGRIEYLNRYMWPVQVVSIPALVRNKQAVLDAIRARLDSEEKRLDAVPSPPSVVIPRQPEATKTATAARPPASAAAGKSRLKRVVESAPQEGAAPTAPTDEPPKSQTPVVEPGSTVTYRDVELDRVREVVLVGPTVPRGIDAVRLHVPLAQALMGARVGQVVPLELASGTRELEILAIKAPRPMDR
jgi:transcription elongation GreA/GreB family factor